MKGYAASSNVCGTYTYHEVLNCTPEGERPLSTRVTVACVPQCQATCGLYFLRAQPTPEMSMY